MYEFTAFMQEGSTTVWISLVSLLQFRNLVKEKLFVISSGVTSVITYGGHISFSDPEAAQCRVKLYQKEHVLKQHCDSVVFVLLRLIFPAHLLIGIQVHEKREASK